MTPHKIPEIGSKAIIVDRPGIPLHLRGRVASIVGCKLRASVDGERFDIELSALIPENEPVIDALWTGEGEPEVGQRVEADTSDGRHLRWVEVKITYVFKTPPNFDTMYVVRSLEGNGEWVMHNRNIRPIKTQAQRDAEAEEKRVDAMAEELYLAATWSPAGSNPVPWRACTAEFRARYTNLIKSGWTKNEA